MSVARMPHRPSDVLEMKEAGYSAEARLALDVAFVGFVERFEAERDATVPEWVKPGKPPRKGQVQVQVPKHKREALLAMLDIDPEEAAASPELAAIAEAAGLDEATWDAIDWGDDEGDAGGEPGAGD